MTCPIHDFLLVSFYVFLLVVLLKGSLIQIDLIVISNRSPVNNENSHLFGRFKRIEK